ncbi:hypothetical protein [Acinetobacter bereziniae]|uniref:hypothetical protein n=1 Tax=Acinetobacter bereziniae TaxID=106648 RepID=UPI0021D3134D|nr:hypothetical protein [Acinetobacter bereziniae]MCU4419578.1 hypothetical protein [Acinetobacter bereziniae]
MLILETNANGQTTIAQGYEEIMNNALSKADHDFIYLNRGKTILELYMMRGSDKKDYFVVEEWMAQNQIPTIVAVVIVQESKNEHELIGKHIYSTKQEALDYAANKFKQEALDYAIN